MAEQDAIRQKTHAWLVKFHEIKDSLQIDRFEEIYAPNAVLKFGNAEEIHGLEGIKKYFEDQFSRLESMKHTIVHFDISFLLDTINDKIYQAASIDYVVKGDPEHRPITIAAMGNFFRYPDVGVDGGKLIRFEVYLDPTPLVGRMEEIAALKEKS